MPTHRAIRIQSTGGALELADVETPPPGRDEVRIAVAACGMCGTDRAFVHGGFPNMSWPLTPGHEIAGTVAELGSGVADFAVGDRVVVGWFGGCCYHCGPCRKGIFIHCENGKVPSWHYPGGYAESVTVPASALARIPSELSDVEAAPMGCAGVTTYHALRSSRAVPGDRVAILGVGGLGHLGIQFARAMGFETIAINRGTAKAEDAGTLGAHHYIDSTSGDVAEAMQALGGAAVVLATAGNSQAMADTVGGLAPRGELVAVGVTPRAPADQSRPADHAGPAHRRASLGYGQGRRGDDAVRGVVGRARVGRGAAAVAGRGGLRGAGGGARALPHRPHHVSRVGL